ncbi:tRNA lysidine(34) synthetase TilS [Ekhidna sp.]
MHSLQKQFHDFIKTNDLVNKGEKILLAVSGGLDSMVMAELFRLSEIPFAIAHCNYGLRGDESDGDEAFVMSWAEKHHVNCFLKAIDLGDGSIQLAARNARYQWFNELCVEHGFNKIATAHHLNDSLETALINLSRGTGVNGISGISVSNNQVIRPLLFATKSELNDYAMDINLEWREDSSNSKTDYDRNHIRHDIVPQLMKLNPSLHSTFKLTSERLNHAKNIISRRVDEIVSNYLTDSGNGWQLALSWIESTSDELILSEILVPYGVNYITAKEIFEARSISGKHFPTQDWLVTIDRGRIFIERVDIGEDIDMELPNLGDYALGNAKLVVEEVSPINVEFGDLNIGHFDMDAIEFPLRVRRWEKGDRFQPLGMKGEKKVSDFLIDEKVPLSVKKSVLVVESAGEIIWVVGKRISENYKIKSNTSEALKLTFLNA